MCGKRVGEFAFASLVSWILVILCVALMRTDPRAVDISPTDLLVRRWLRLPLLEFIDEFVVLAPRFWLG